MAKSAIGRRVRYVRTKGKAGALPWRAEQALRAVERAKVGITAAGLMAALRVNRNVIAGALHLLRRARLIRSEVLAPLVETRREQYAAGPAGESPPRVDGDGRVIFTRPQAMRMLREMSRPRMTVWQALKLPIGPSNRAVAAEKNRG